MADRINYVVCGWTGQREKLCEGMGGEYFIAEHVDALRKLEHSLAQVTIVLPENPAEHPGLEARLIGNGSMGPATIEVIRRKNYGISYGSFSAAYERGRQKFDRYIFVEDDYIPAFDHFDSALVDLQDELECDYLCQLMLDDRRFGTHAALTCGMLKTEMLERIFVRDGRLPHAAENNGTPAGMYDSVAGQVAFSRVFMDAGFVVKDMTSRFRAQYCHRVGVIREWGRAAAPVLFQPEQARGPHSIMRMT